MKLAETDQSVLDYICEFYNGRVIPEGMSFFNGVRKQAANRLVRKGLLARVEGPMGFGYRVTETGMSKATPST